MGNEQSRLAILGATARSTGRRRSGARTRGSARRLITRSVRVLLVAAFAGCLFWLVWIYGIGLRDARYLDGWILAGGMSLQLSFHIANKTASLSPKASARWRRIHILVGYLLVIAFVSHTDFSLPDTGFEWALWTAFVLVALSGIFGTYFAWSLQSTYGIDDRFSYELIPTRRVEMARDVQSVVAMTDSTAAAIALPAQPHDAWIMELYTTRLRDFFEGQHNTFAHLIGSQRPLRMLTEEIDNLSLYVDKQCQEKLTAIKTLVVEKDRLDFARVYLGLIRIWLFVHVPATYALMMLTMLHIIVVYSFSSGAW